jgi:tyrosyl-DNA phosphodiesterase 2
VVDTPQIPSWSFDHSKQAWTPAGKSIQFSRPNITLATFNVWFGEYELSARCDALLGLLRDCGADIIALQEVTAPFLERMLAQSWVRRDFVISDATGATFPDYGVVLLSRVPVHRFELYDLPTTMSRKLVLCRLAAGALNLDVGAVHLESLKEFGMYREEQLRAIFRILEPRENAVLLGDFNFCSSWDENELIDDRYSDLWPLLHPDDPGWTVDGESNAMRPALGKSGKQVRFDRILVRAKSGSLQVQSIRLLGTAPVSPDLPEVFPSDHFGLVATLERG